jgi:dipeptidyl aminopeptidase/acylaminoacyl peptidase
MDRVVVLQPDGSITENAVGGPDRLITPPDTIGPVQEVSWSPDGSQVAIVMAGPVDADVPSADVWTVDVATATPVEVASGLVGLVRVAWAPDATRLAIAWVDPVARTGRGLVAVPGVAASAFPFSPLLAATDASQPAITLVWSDDSRRIALVLSFTSQPATTTAVVAAADGTTLNATDPATTPIVPDTPSFAPDGRTVLVPTAGLLLDDTGHQVAIDRVDGQPAWLDASTYVGSLALQGRLSLVHLSTPLAPVALPPALAHLALPTAAPATRTLLVGDPTTGALSFLDPDAAVAMTVTTPDGPIAWPIGWL